MTSNPEDPFAPRDATVLRPRPGAGRRSGAEVPAPEAMPAPLAGHAGAPGAGSPVHATAPLADFASASGNLILQGAAPLLILASRLQAGIQQANVATLRQQAVHEIRSLEERLRAAGVSNEDALVGRYMICTFVDSAVLNTPWGAQSDWSAQSLLVMFHKEVSGGEKFFQIVDRISAAPERYIDLIELAYVCMALGFEGKHRLEPNGQARLAELQHGLFRFIRERRQLREAELSPQWRGVENRKNPVIMYLPWWMAAAAGAAALAIGFFFYQTKLRTIAEPIKASLIAPSATVPYGSSVGGANRLRILLANEEAARRLTVEEAGERTIVTLVAPDLFRSGSATVNSTYLGTLKTVALALNEVPGAVQIVGHTDDEPVRSFRFSDNFELSRERAVSVASLIKPWLRDAGRLQWTGAGSTQPRYQPVDTEENRARNRRVEIISTPTSGVR